jgi:AP-1-like factor
LEDQVAALEEKNKEAQSENSNLRDLLARLQQENLALKQSQFTFSVPKPMDPAVPQASSSTSPPSVHAPFSFFGTTPPPPLSTSTASQPSPKPFNDIDWSSLTTFDPSMLNAMDETPSGSMQIDPSTSPYGQYALPAPNQYKTLATNTFFMSFADTPESSSFNNVNTSTDISNNNNPNGLNQFPFNFSSSPNSWNGARNGQPTADFSQYAGHSDFMQNNTLDELFGGASMNSQGPLDFSAMMKSTTAPTLSPVTHANGNGQSPQSSISSSQNSVTSPLSANPLSPPSSATTSNEQSPFSWTMPRSDAESPPSASESVSNVNPGCGEMPRCPTREDIARHIAASGDSPFTSSPFTLPAVRKTSDFSQGGGSNMISCEGSTFPKTKESPANIDVLKAWRTITSHPQFKVGVAPFFL